MCLDAADPVVRHAIENAALLATARCSINPTQFYLLHSINHWPSLLLYVMYVFVSIIQSRPVMLLLEIDRCMYDRYDNDVRSTDY